MATLLSEHVSVTTLISLLHDGELGFQTLSEHISEPQCRLFLVQESFMRAAYAGELETALGKIVQEPVHEEGTTIGTLHRRWLDLKAGLGFGTSELLHSLRTCELALTKAYDLVLAQTNLDPTLRPLIEHQRNYIHNAYKALQHRCGVSEN